MGIRKNWKVWSLFSLLCLIWGSSFYLIKLGLEAYSPIQVAVVRLGCTLPFVAPFALKFLRQLSRTSLGYVIVVGLLSTLIPSFLFALAQTKVNSATAGILNATVPIFTVVIGYLGFRKTINRVTFLAIVIGLFAVGTIILKRSDETLSINQLAIFILLATFGYGLNINTVKAKLKEIDAFAIAMVSVFFSGLLVLPLLILDWQSYRLDTQAHDLKPLWALLTLGILGTALAQYLQNAIIKLTDTEFASSVTYVIPIVAVFWGLLDGEEVNLTTIVAGICILLCVYLIRRG
ncbi:DMT family transporter [Flagellimonas meridianipacifica]|uniref:Drug/metabolite transporter (DMT)-like permease n=1 Tax=Flagellimonas meridianipacifica TaxID=1080225 RepID=A0A2T0M9Y2_9FLAO|nr:DMT family transporter [Allomuricauda pacifica]PRX54275.1 drug/metabolite transporter (DMT)-like permease [Allomuricauda pacifica]